jgi:hypothetical protein
MTFASLRSTDVDDGTSDEDEEEGSNVDDGEVESENK